MSVKITVEVSAYVQKDGDEKGRTLKCIRNKNGVWGLALLNTVFEE